MNASYTVTTSSGVPPGSLAGYNQIWDLRYDAALSGADVAAYTTYLSGGGSLFVLGEHLGFAARDNSIVSFMAGLGGGTVTLNGSGSQSAQTVLAPFTGPVTLSMVYLGTAGGFSALGNGRAITLDADNIAGAMVLPPGSLTGAIRGTLISALDVGFLSNGEPGGQPFTDNVIGYFASQSPVGSPSATPAPSTLLLVGIGLGAAGLYVARFRREPGLKRSRS